ncbi:MAG: hypothetical protein HQL10_12405 [Nitrospirae bacterium]|nr:hypothetical protein [Nitrospirota bacterium]
MFKSAVNQENRRIISFFTKWFYIGFGVLLLGITLESYKQNIIKEWMFAYSIAIEFLKNIGIAIIISNIFSYILGTQEFMSYLRQKLIEIVVSKDFLHKLNREERREMLKIILKPTKELSEIYSGINQYFSRYIEDSMNLFHAHFRSGYMIVAEASMDSETNRVKVVSEMDHRIYRVMGEYEKLPVGFEDEDSKMLSTKLFSPNGEEQSSIDCKVVNKAELNDDILAKDPALINGTLSEIPESFKKYTQLDVKRKLVEYGVDHWHLYTYRAKTPCDKLNISLMCRDGLEVKKVVTYGRGSNFKIDKSTDNSRVTVSCNDWLEPGFGVAILLAKNTRQLPLASEVPLDASLINATQQSNPADGV